MESKCQHDIMDSENNTIKLDKKKRTMSYPPTMVGKCHVCGCFVHYVKLDGIWVEQQNKRR